MHVHYSESVQRGPCPPGEPTGNLDGENTRIVMEILRRLAHEEGRCVIVVTHDPEAAGTGGRVLRMKDGVLTAA